MKRDTQLELIRELLDLHDKKTPFLDDNWERRDVDRYLAADRFERESARIFRRLPHIVAHVSELPEPGDFLTRDFAGRPILMTRDETGAVKAFYNVCRHRGARLVREQSGCKKRFSCPYHAWTWDNGGELVGVPHEKTGFPDLQRGDFGLKPVACEEFAGWIWLCLADNSEIDVASHLGEIGDELLAMDAANHVIADTTVRDVCANWKILVEGGIESYHFRVAHADTIAPLFLDNLSTYRCLGPHMRSVLPRSTFPDMKEQPAIDHDLLKHANVLYTLFPGAQFLVQEDHFVWIKGTPVTPDRTVLTLSTMVPKEDLVGDKQNYWKKHHQLTIMTLEEDFVLGEEIQAGLASGANEHLNFGRFEGALTKFNALVDKTIA